jgi:hypothetical protein
MTDKPSGPRAPVNLADKLALISEHWSPRIVGELNGSDHPMAHDPRFPIGPFVPPTEITPAQVVAWIDQIEALPGDMRQLVGTLSTEQLATRYRLGGWTVRQVVHHVADSHMNSFIRFKWALTEERPVIKDYREALWAELPDTRDTPVRVSLDLLAALHTRWCVLLRALQPADLDREFVHPESGPVALGVNIGVYAWHGRHHLAHIRSVAEAG